MPTIFKSLNEDFLQSRATTMPREKRNIILQSSTILERCADADGEQEKGVFHSSFRRECKLISIHTTTTDAKEIKRNERLFNQPVHKGISILKITITLASISSSPESLPERVGLCIFSFSHCVVDACYSFMNRAHCESLACCVHETKDSEEEEGKICWVRRSKGKRMCEVTTYSALDTYLNK